MQVTPPSPETLNTSFDASHPILSLKSPHRVRYGAHEYANAELAMYASLVIDHRYYPGMIAGYKTAAPAKSLFTRYNIPFVVDQEDLIFICYMKALNNPEVKQFLFNCPNSTFVYGDINLMLGTGIDTKGKNMLGVAWGAAREQLYLIDSQSV
jgi:hypothetical protein